MICYVLYTLYVFICYICIPLGILGSTPCVEAHHSDHAKPDDFNTPSKYGSALSMGVGAASG